MANASLNLRRWFQFSLRTLLLGMLLIAVFLGGRSSNQSLIDAERAKADAERDRATAAERRTQPSTAAETLAKIGELLALAEKQLEQESRGAEDLSRTLESRSLQLQRQIDELKPFVVPTFRVRERVRHDFDPNRWRTEPVNEYWQRQDHPRRCLYSLSTASQTTLS